MLNEDRNIRRQLYKRIWRAKTYGVVITVIAILSIAFCALLIFTGKAAREKEAAAEAEVSSLSADLLSKEKTIKELENEKKNLSSANEKLGEDVKFYSKILSENQLRIEIMLLFEEQKYPTYMVLKKIYPEKMVVLDSGNFRFLDIDRSLKANEYVNEQFIYDEEKKKMSYNVEGKDITRKGIDVSKYNETINWEKAAKAGLDFCFIRLGLRGYVSGEIVMDEYFEDNLKNAVDNGVETGVYFFSQAVTEEEAIEEADYVLENIEDKGVTGPVAIDIEKIDYPDTPPRTAEMTADERTDVVIAFCKRIEEAGYKPMIYGNLLSFLSIMNNARLEEYDKWFADFIDAEYEDYLPYFAYDFNIWQYTAEGEWPGVKGACDLNIALK
ncbi:MAG: glycoside hydrolase family 25 protein [Lachnospiraceae bacterium]|nr:glycoside hydrolase family 25 protein [Lachnospiraceae bacterium]